MYVIKMSFTNRKGYEIVAHAHTLQEVQTKMQELKNYHSGYYNDIYYMHI